MNAGISGLTQTNLLNNTLNQHQQRTNSRNQTTGSSLAAHGLPGQHGLNNTLTGPIQYDSSNFTLDMMISNALGQKNNMNGSPNILNKKASSYSRNTKNAHNMANNKQYYTQNVAGIKELTRTDLITEKPGSSSKMGGNSSVNRQNSNRRVQQQNLTQVKNQPNSGQNSIQVANLTQLLKDQAIIGSGQGNGVLPPMTTTNKQSQNMGQSRNQNYKGSLTESLNGKLMKGLSPKASSNDHQNQSPNKNHRANSQIQASAKVHSQNFNQIDNSIENQLQNQLQAQNAQLKNNKTSGGILGRTRNAAQSLGRNDLIGNNKPQFYTMKNQTTGSMNVGSTNPNITQQSPHNYTGRFNNSQKTQQQPVAQSSSGFGLEYDPTVGFVQSYDPAKFATKRNGVVVSYAANTHQGIIRNYNEDRVSIILNIIQPKFKETKNWPRCSFFGVYDGHGGAACADYLRDQLHQLIVKDPNFPSNPKKAIENAFEESEKQFMEYADQQAVLETGQIDRSGSCAIIVLIVGDICYCANVGDSRAIMSVDGGEKILMLSKDHKPESDDETKRIEENGGRIYQNSNYIPDANGKGQMQLIVGPHRVFPGRLSVSRTFGDIEAKEVKYGGNPKVVIPTPDIICFKIKNNYDFVIIACDGVFEKLNNQDVVQAVWQASKKQAGNNQEDNRSIHEKCGHGVDRILHTSAFRKTFDNITAVMIAFENFENIAGQSTVVGQSHAHENPQIYHIDQHQNHLETVVEEEYMQSEELELNSIENNTNSSNKKEQVIDNGNYNDDAQEISKPVYNQMNSNDVKVEYQFDVNNNNQFQGSDNNYINHSNSKTRKKSAENNLKQSQSQLNSLQRRQSASSPLNQRGQNIHQHTQPQIHQQQQYQSQQQQQQNSNSMIQNPNRMSYQSNSRLSSTTLMQQKAQEEQLLRERIQEQLLVAGHKSNPATTGSIHKQQQDNSRGVNKSSSLGRRDNNSRQGAAASSVIEQNRLSRNSAQITSSNTTVDNGKGFSSSSRNESRNLKLSSQQQQMSLTQSLVGGLAPLTSGSSYSQDQTQKFNFQHQPMSTTQASSSKNHSRNYQLKQYNSLGGAVNQQQIQNIMQLNNNSGGSLQMHQDVDQVSRAQQLTQKQQHQQHLMQNFQHQQPAKSQLQTTSMNNKNWLSNTQQLTGISQLNNPNSNNGAGQDQRKNSRGKHSLL